MTSKLSIVLFLAACVCYINAFDDDKDPFKDPFFHKHDVKPLDMPDMPKMPVFTPIDIPTIKPPSESDIINLQPDGPNTHVEGNFTSHSSSTKMVDGKIVEDKSSSKEINNDNGKVDEHCESKGE